MRELRYAGPGDDATHVVITDGIGPNDGERYVLVLDDALRTAVRAAATELARREHPDEPAPALSPREIQTRVRAGASAEEIAADGDLAVDKVMRFAFPVLQERARVADEARRARARRTTPQGELVIFGEAVDGRLAAHGVDPAEVGWDAFRRPDGQWTVTAAWAEDGEQRSAQWSFGLTSRVIGALDETAGDLLSDRPLAPLVEAVAPEPEDVAEVGGAWDGEGTGVDDRLPTGPMPFAPRLVGDDWSAVTESQAGEDDPAPGDDLPLPLAFDVPPGETDPVARRLRGSHRAERNRGKDVPAFPTADLSGAHDDLDETGKAARARIPSWDDILLGVRRRGD